MLRTQVSDQNFLSVLSEPIYCRRDRRRSSPACQAPSGMARRKASPGPAVLTHPSGKYPHIQSLMTASIPQRSFTSAPLQLSAWVIAFSSFPFDRPNPPLTPATVRVDFSAVVAFILGRIVINHVQYPL